MLFGPSSVSSKKLFAIGAAAGALEMQLGMKFGASVGSTAGSLFQSSLNQLFSDDPFLSWQTAMQIGLDSSVGLGTGALADWYDPQDAKRALELFMLCLDKDIVRFDLEELVKILE